MPRAIWSGSISFGLVNIPVKLYNAVSRKTVHFNQIDTRTGSRIRQKRVSAADGTEVPPEALAKGYELTSGHYVVVTDEELALLDPEATRSVEIEQFVDIADIDPVFYDAAYYVAPDQATVKPYALLCQAMRESGKVGIARFVMRTKQYLAAIRPMDGVLALSTMVYADEVNDPASIPEIEAVDGVEVSDRELKMAQQLIESLSDPWVAEAFHDTYREQVVELIERKAAGETELVEAPAPVSSDKVVDLMAALEASVAAAKQARQRHPTGAEPEPEQESTEAADAAAPGEPPATKPAPKRAPAKKRKAS